MPDESQNAPSDDDFDRHWETLLTASDPGRRPMPVDRLRQQWTQLAAGRNRRMRTARAIVIATAACVMLAFGLIMRPGTNGPSMAVNESNNNAATDNAAEQTSVESASGVGSDEPSPTADTPIDPENSSRTTAANPSRPASKAARPTDAFAQAIDRLNAIGRQDPSFQPSATGLMFQVRQLPAAMIEQLIRDTAEMKDNDQRNLAMQVIDEAAAGDVYQVRMIWLRYDSTRERAWKMLVQESDRSQWPALAALADEPSERRLLCEHLADRCTEGGVDALVRLAALDPWREPIASACQEMDIAAMDVLLTRLDSGPKHELPGVAFVIASMRDPQIDSNLAKMIVSRRYQLPAYQALIARNTPAARRFLSIAAQENTLSPALAAAWRRSERWRPQAYQWVSQIRSEEDVQDNLLFDRVPRYGHLAFAGYDDPGRGTARRSTLRCWRST